MTVYRLYKDRAFEPEFITMMTSAYSDVCRMLGLDEGDDADAKKVAQSVIESTQRGISDPGRLRDRVFEALRTEQGNTL